MKYDANEYYETEEVQEAVSSTALHLADQVAREVADMPDVQGEYLTDCAIDSVIAWPVMDRIMSKYGVPPEVRADLVGLFARTNHYKGVAGWDRGYGAGWDAALEVWGLKSCD